MKNAIGNLSPTNLKKSLSMNFSQNSKIWTQSYQSKSFIFDEINNDINEITTKEGIK